MITKLFKESFLISGKIQQWSITGPNYVEIFKNPSTKEYNALGNYARGFIDDKGNLYVWYSEWIHYYVIKFLKEKNIVRQSATDNLITVAGIPVELNGKEIVFGESIHNISEKQDLVNEYVIKCKEKNKYFDFVLYSF
jgi:hypothetical protein